MWFLYRFQNIDEYGKCKIVQQYGKIDSNSSKGFVFYLIWGNVKRLI